ncbi:MAG TPA: PAS domain-containing protein [Longimicrobiaceae bacterium]|nr:PAS domain-containing protein [Longimicrobiaceae bacterium]
MTHGPRSEHPAGPGPERAAGDAPSPSAERVRALERGRAFRLDSPGAETPGHVALRAANPALAAIADHVRHDSIVLLDPAGIVTFWGAGAHLMTWWAAEEAEGAHLALLYPEPASEDGTAAAHLRQAGEGGEYAGEGQRVRRDGSTFWAGVTLTALRDAHGAPLGFAGLIRDLTASRGAEAMLAGANAMAVSRDAALALVQREHAARLRAEETAEFAQAHLRGAREYNEEVLEPQLAEEQAHNRTMQKQIDAEAVRRDREGHARDAEREASGR